MHALATNFAGVPVIPKHNQDGVADGLPRQAGARRTEGHRDLIALGQLQQRHNFIFGLDADHQFRDQSIKTRVGAEGQG